MEYRTKTFAGKPQFDNTKKTQFDNTKKCGSKFPIIAMCLTAPSRVGWRLFYLYDCVNFKFTGSPGGSGLLRCVGWIF